ncbi:MAG: hypothetical protein K0U66_01930 [Gammaproteobacteria bacterium]|nr:hypothetical protein [Gammaproteobacteria bacterium]
MSAPNTRKVHLHHHRAQPPLWGRLEIATTPTAIPNATKTTGLSRTVSPLAPHPSLPPPGHPHHATTPTATPNATKTTGLSRTVSPLAPHPSLPPPGHPHHATVAPQPIAIGDELTSTTTHHPSLPPPATRCCPLPLRSMCVMIELVPSTLYT